MADQLSRPRRALPVLSIATSLLMFLLGLVVGVRGATQNAPWLRTLLGKGENIPLLRSLDLVKNTEAPVSYEDVDFSVFWEVWRLLEREYLEPDKIVAKGMVDGAIGGMVSSLKDPYTMYLPPAELQRSGEDLAGSFYGVGIELGYISETLAVVAPLPGGPAEKAGIKAKDLITHVKDTSANLDSDTTGWTLNEAVGHIRGKRGSEVTLTIVRTEGDKAGAPFEVTLKRDEIIVPSVELKFVEKDGKKVAHLKLMRFGERTEDEWNKAVQDIVKEQKSIKGVVLDLRNNPGGFFDGAILVASEFIDKGVIVTQQGREAKEDFTAEGKARLVDIPVEVVVNRGSASSSEIVAGALRDRRKAKLIGEKTYGKGTVQDRHELSNGGGVHVTIARFLLPSGEWIHDTGIPVDVEIQDDTATQEDEVLQKAIDEL